LHPRRDLALGEQKSKAAQDRASTYADLANEERVVLMATP
jgi:hypothetical protein